MKNLKFFYGLLLLSIGLFFFVGCNPEENMTSMEDVTIDERTFTTQYPNIIFYALGTNNELYKYRSGPPATALGVLALKGLRPNEMMVAIDFRPATKTLYGVSNMNFIYTINLNPVLGSAQAIVTQISQTPFFPVIEGECVGFDFDPVKDRIRLVTDKYQNLRIHPPTGQVVAIDFPINGASAAINSVAYSNNYAGALGTTLYDVDLLEGKMYRQNSNAGTLTLIGSTGLTIYGEGGFDISRTRVAMGIYLAAGQPVFGTSDYDDTLNKAYRLYGLNLKTGKATSLGTVRPSIGFAIP